MSDTEENTNSAAAATANVAKKLTSKQYNAILASVNYRAEIIEETKEVNRKVAGFKEDKR